MAWKWSKKKQNTTETQRLMECNLNLVHKFKHNFVVCFVSFFKLLSLPVSYPANPITLIFAQFIYKLFYFYTNHLLFLSCKLLLIRFESDTFCIHNLWVCFCVFGGPKITFMPQHNNFIAQIYTRKGTKEKWTYKLIASHKQKWAT